MPKARERDAAARIMQEAAGWFVRVHADVLRLVDYLAFLGWLGGDDRHRRSYRRLELIWHHAPGLRDINRALAGGRGERSLMGLSDEWMQYVCPALRPRRAPQQHGGQVLCSSHALNLPVACASR